MTAPSRIKNVGFDFESNTGTVTVPITNAPSAGNFLFLTLHAAHRETPTPSEPTWTDPSGWTLIDSEYYALPDGGTPSLIWWGQTRIYWKTATASETSVSITSTGDGMRYGRIEEFSAATVVSSQSYYGVNAAPSPADTYTSGTTDRSVFWAITAPKNNFGPGNWTEVDLANFVQVDRSSSSGSNIFYKGAEYFDQGTSGTIDLPRLDQVNQDFALNRFPWAAIAVEIRKPLAGWVRGHAWG